jgi:hypothetical protein
VFSNDEIKQYLEEFFRIYTSSPIRNNDGGMKFPQAFGLYYFLRKINPSFVVESGIWKGFSTWLIEQACPNAKVCSIDLNLDSRQYISKAIDYSCIDFRFHNFRDFDPSKTLCFFDDHVNAFDRIVQSRFFGFRWLVFEDNYPIGQGDSPSLDQFFGGGYGEPPKQAKGIRQRIENGLKQKLLARRSTSDQFEAETLGAIVRGKIDFYFVFPPVVGQAFTRWGTDWVETYKTEPLFSCPEEIGDERMRKIIQTEAVNYTQICIVRLKE